MTWSPNATVTVNGTSFTDKSLAGVQVNYGRTNIWEQPRAGYAVVNILNTTNSDYGFQPRQEIVIKVNNSSGTPVTIFTGKVTQINNRMANVGSVMNVAVQQLTAVSPLAEMSRVVSGANYAKQYDDVRLNAILTASGVDIDVVDTPGVYEFQAYNNGYVDTYTLASKYAQMAFGYIYDTPSGKVGYANESHRLIDANTNGYFNIPKSYILGADVNSSKTDINLLNDVVLSYKANATVTSQDLSSQTSYGLAAGTVSTELENTTEAQYQADRYITLRSTPRTNVGQFSIPVDADFISNTNRNTLLNIYMGKPIQIDNLPMAIKNQTYKGFVEGWNWQIYRNTCQLTLTTTDSTLSIIPTRWQDVSATLKWSDLDPALQWSNYE